MFDDEENPFEYPANAQEVLPLPQRKVFKRTKNFQEFHEIDLFDDTNDTANSPDKKKPCTEIGSMTEVAGQLKLILPTLAALTKDMAEIKKAQNQNSSLNRSGSLDRTRSQVFESRKFRINALERAGVSENQEEMDYEQTQSQSQSQADTSTPKSSASQSSSILEASFDPSQGSRSRSHSRQREQPREEVRGGFSQAGWRKKNDNYNHDRTRKENSYPDNGGGRGRVRGRGGGRGGRSSDRRHEGDDTPFSDMSKGEVYRMFNQICNNAHTQAEKSKEFAVREVIISGQEESKDDLSLAVAAIQTVIPSIRRSDIYMVSRFQRPDETSFRPLKAVFYRESLAKEVVETVESSEANRKKFDYIRRGLTWRQRAANSRARNYVEEKNLDIPVGHPDRWEIQQVGGFQIAVQPERQKEKMKANTYQRPRGQTEIRNSNTNTNHATNNQQRTNTKDHTRAGEPKPSTSEQASKKKTTSTKISMTSADAEAALIQVNTAVASTNPDSKKKTQRSTRNRSSGTSRGGKAKKAKPPRVPDASLMTTAEKKRMHKQLGEDLMNLPSTRSNRSETY